MMGQRASGPKGPSLLHESLSDAVLCEVFQKVEAKTLVKTCPLVCERWRRLLAENSFWAEKCTRDGVVLPPLALRQRYKFDFKIIAIKRPYERNFVKNPSGEDELKQWTILENGGNNWAVEHPPAGADSSGQDPGGNSVDIPICFATSYGTCAKAQTIDLVKEGVEPWVLDDVKPLITVSEWHAARFDCGAKYQYRVELLDMDPGNPERKRSYWWGPGQDEIFFQSEGSDSEDWEDYPSDDETCGGTSFQRRKDPHFLGTTRKATVKGLHRDRVETPQWAGREWKQWTHTFSDYPTGVRFLRFWHSGVDTQFWAGHYGPKMSKASVRVGFATETV